LLPGLASGALSRCPDILGTFGVGTHDHIDTEGIDDDRRRLDLYDSSHVN
jgi:hypothetical protein